MTHPPKSLQGILWSSGVDQLDLEQHKRYIIHQLLLYGDLKELRWLLMTYGKDVVQEVFTRHPAKLYSRELFYFIKNYILGLKKYRLNENNYVTSLYGPIRQRTA